MQPAVSVSRLNAACMGMESVRVSAGSGARVSFPLQIRSRDEYLHGPTEEDQDEASCIIRPSSGSSIASLVLSIDGQRAAVFWGQAVDEREPKVTSSRVRVSRPKVSHLFAFSPTSNRVRHSGCCMAPLLLFLLGTDAP